MSATYFLSVLRSGLGVTISRIFGLVRDIAIAGVFGATGVTDIFFVAFAIPNLFRQFFAEGAMSSAYVPFLCDKSLHQGEEKAHTYLTQLIVIQTVLVTLVSVMLILLAPFVIKVFMPGIARDAASVAMGANILRIVMPYLLFISITGLLAGFLNLKGSYFVAYASTAALNLMMIMGAAIGYYKGNNIYSLAVSVIAGGMCQLIIVYIYSYRKGFRIGVLSPPDADIKKTYKLLVPSLAGVGISQLNFMIGRIVASFLREGSISWLFYANRLFQLPLGVFSVTISTVSLTELSKAHTAGDTARVSELIDKAILIMLLVILPATIGLVGLAKEIVYFIYARNAFTETDAVNTAVALQMYSLGLIFFSLASVFTRVFHAEKNTKTPVKIAFIAFIVNFVLNIVLMKPMAHAGIALASSIAALINTVLLYVCIRNYRFNIRKQAPLLLKMLISAYAMLFVMIIGKYMHVPLLINISLCAAVYFGILHLTKANIKSMFR